MPADDTSQTWTPAQVAEDLLAQLDDAASAGFAPSVLLRALQDEGLEASTATALVELGMRTAPATRDPAEGSNASAPEELADADAAVELWPVRAWLHAHEDAGPLIDAFVAAGLARVHSEALLAGATRAGQHIEAVRAARLRKVGLQGVAVGGACALFFGWHALTAGAGGLWNLVPAGAALALTLYAAALWWRHR